MSASTSKVKKSENDRKESMAFIKDICERRNSEAIVSQDYDFDLSRRRFLTECRIIKPGRPIIYYMQRDFRINDNWGIIYAQMLALQKKVSLHICFFAKQTPSLYPTMRQFEFLVEGLKEVAVDANSYGMKFYFINDFPQKLITLVRENRIGAVITDQLPLRASNQALNILKMELPKDIPLIQVDAHNIVPVWIASDHEETAARTIRPKITNMLPKYLTEFPALTNCRQGSILKDGKVEMQVGIDGKVEEFFKATATPVEGLQEIKWAMPGGTAALMRLYRFMKLDLKDYAEFGSNPNYDCVSKISPWLHFGNVSAQRVALEVSRYKKICKEGVEKYLEELIIRRELSDNFCHYNVNYDNISGAKKWAQDTLSRHKDDKREYLYTLEQFTKAETHDPIWNAAQVQLLREGRIHNYMRMYWCKKILEWTATPKEAIEIAVHLNDVYSLDGNDPNGYVGIMWSICGLHDQGYKERPIFGKIRYMVDYSLVKKFGIEEYKRRYVSYTEGEDIAVPMRPTVNNRNKKRGRKPKTQDPAGGDAPVASTSRGPPAKKGRPAKK